VYLTSYRLGDTPEELVRLAGQRKHVAVIANAGDASTGNERAKYVQREIDDLEELGFTAEEVDLRDWFGRRRELSDHMKERQFGVVWVKGGNTFVLRRAFRQSGFDKVVTRALSRDEFVYAGYSAGAILAGPTLRGTELMDEPDLVPDGYDEDIIWDGLHLVPFIIVPHMDSDHPESDAASECAAALAAAGRSYVALRDGETVIEAR
jgi:dipeptidase E